MTFTVVYPHSEDFYPRTIQSADIQSAAADVLSTFEDADTYPYCIRYTDFGAEVCCQPYGICYARIWTGDVR